MTKAEREHRKLASTALPRGRARRRVHLREGRPIGFQRVSIKPDEAEGTLGHVLQRRVPAAAARDAEAGIPVTAHSQVPGEQGDPGARGPGGC